MLRRDERALVNVHLLCVRVRGCATCGWPSRVAGGVASYSLYKERRALHPLRAWGYGSPRTQVLYCATLFAVRDKSANTPGGRGQNGRPVRYGGNNVLFFFVAAVLGFACGPRGPTGPASVTAHMRYRCTPAGLYYLRRVNFSNMLLTRVGSYGHETFQEY